MVIRFFATLIVVVWHVGLARQTKLIPLNKHVYLLDNRVNRVFILNVQRNVLNKIEVVYNLHNTLVQLKVFWREELVDIGQTLLCPQRYNLIQKSFILIVILDTFPGLL